MDQNIFLNPRQRRKSNLGRRRTYAENPPPRRPVFAVPVPRGLGRSRSAKKLKSPLKEAASGTNSGLAKKRLFTSFGVSPTNTSQEMNSESESVLLDPLKVEKIKIGKDEDEASQVFTKNTNNCTQTHLTLTSCIKDEPYDYYEDNIVKTEHQTNQDQADASSRPGSNRLSPSQYFTDQLNVTGIRAIKTPSPTYENFKSVISRINSSKRHEDPLSITSLTHSRNKEKHLHTDSILEQIFGASKPPDSPGPSLYNRLILEEDLQPPVDPDDLIPLENLSLDTSSTHGRPITSTIVKHASDSRISSVFSPHLSSTCTSTTVKHASNSRISSVFSPHLSSTRTSTTVKHESDSRISSAFSPHLSSTCVDSILVSSDKKVNSSCLSDKKLSIIDEDSDSMDSMDSFLLTEQTIIDQNNTVTGPITSAETLSSTILENNNVKQMLVENPKSETDEEIENVLEEMDKIMKKMEGLKKKVQRLKNKRQQSKNAENKENISAGTVTKVKIHNPAATATKVGMNNWIKDIKSNNPGLLKTPKLTKHNNSRYSLGDQSTIWTPHSLSTVLHEQVEDLFD